MQRPDITEIKTGKEFNRWYWLKAEMIEICKHMKLPYSGSKFELRDRIMYALDHEGQAPPRPQRPNKTSKFNWAKESLSLDTVITDNITFGQNLRAFMQGQIGEHFVFHTEFMAWAKAHPGKTLAEAVVKWEELEALRHDPNHRTKIAAHNMLLQYVRDFLDDHPELAFKDALACWKQKKLLPTETGFIRYEEGDLDLLQ